MKVFIGWSGERSRAIALALREWIPNVIQAADPWMSEEDISKGTGWTGELTTELGQSCFGIICVTPENQESVWLAFEAGALSKVAAKVCPYLLVLERINFKGPLANLFQVAKAEKEETLRMMRALNEASGAPIANDRLGKQFNQWWPDLEKGLADAESLVSISATDRSERELLDEILGLVRAEAIESRAFAKVRTDFATLFSRLLGSASGVNPELIQALQQTLLRLASPLENVRLSQGCTEWKVAS